MTKNSYQMKVTWREIPIQNCKTLTRKKKHWKIVKLAALVFLPSLCFLLLSSSFFVSCNILGYGNTRSINQTFKNPASGLWGLNIPSEQYQTEQIFGEYINIKVAWATYTLRQSANSCQCMSVLGTKLNHFRRAFLLVLNLTRVCVSPCNPGQQKQCSLIRSTDFFLLLERL